MTDRNRLSAGEFFVPLPVGFPLTLKYDENGVLVQVCKGYERGGEDVSSIFLYSFVNDHIVPNKVALKKGTTYVSGILYTSAELKGCGKLPECKYDDIISKYKDSRKGFKFFALSVTSLSAVFNGAVNIRQWLTFSKFTVPQGILLSSKTCGDVDTYLFNHGNDDIWSNINFKFPKIPEYVIFSTKSVEYGSFDIFENKVSSTKQYILDSGVIDCKVKLEAGKDDMSVPYSEVVKYNIQKNTTLIYDKNLNILYSQFSGNKRVSDTILCSSCGKLIKVPKFGVTTCSDVNCNSRLYPRVKQFLTTLHLPYIDFSRYEEVCKSKGLDFHVPDILDIDEYKDVELKCTVFELLRAITPKFVMPDDSVLLQFCNTCKNASGTVQYYLQFPNDIQIDISYDIQNSMKPVVDWYSNSDNMKDLVSVFHNDKIKIVSENIQFDGAPIFRNTSIVITGKFIHGSYDVITSILKGYGAEVDTEVDENTDCIVTGSMMENISGHVIKQGRKYNVPIIDENEFFSMYDIDSDLRENL